MYTMGLFSESVAETNVTWLLWVALGFFALMVVIGWLSSRRQKPENEQSHNTHEEHKTEDHG